MFTSNLKLILITEYNSFVTFQQNNRLMIYEFSDLDSINFIKRISKNKVIQYQWRILGKNDSLLQLNEFLNKRELKTWKVLSDKMKINKKIEDSL